MGLFSSLFGGGSETSSTTSTSTTTNNADRRFVVDNNSVGVSSETAEISVMQTDYGSIEGAFDLAKTSSATAAATIMGALGIAADTLRFQATQIQRDAETAAAQAEGGGIAGWMTRIEPKQWAWAALGLFGLALVLKKGK